MDELETPLKHTNSVQENKAVRQEASLVEWITAK